MQDLPVVSPRSKSLVEIWGRMIMASDIRDFCFILAFVLVAVIGLSGLLAEFLGG